MIQRVQLARWLHINPNILYIVIVIKINMNRYAFNPDVIMVQQWRDVYLSSTQINSLQSIISRTTSYLKALDQQQQLTLLKQNSSSSPTKRLRRNLSVNQVAQDLQKSRSMEGIDEIKEWGDTINRLKQEFRQEYQQSLRKKQEREGIIKDGKEMSAAQKMMLKAFTRVTFDTKMGVVEKHLLKLRTQANYCLQLLIEQQITLSSQFFDFKHSQLCRKHTKLVRLLERIDKEDGQFSNLKLLYENLFIQTHYLQSFVETNVKTLQKQYNERDSDSIGDFYERHFETLSRLKARAEDLKKNLRVTYFDYLKKKTSRLIIDHRRLQQHIIKQIAVNADDYKQQGNGIVFFNGFMFAVLLLSLLGVITLREVNIDALEGQDSYLIQFRIWRGASYLLCFNWVTGIVLYLYDKLRINYHLILLQGNYYVPRPQDFFFTATVLSGIYLVLFLVFTLKQLGIIEGHYQLNNLGYYMWIINVVFMVNPFKVLNYEGRMYFLKVFWRVLASVYIHTDWNIFYLTIIIGSFVQPFSDFYFTLCEVTQGSPHCDYQANIATFMFVALYFILRIVQSIRMHKAYGGGLCYSRAYMGMTHAFFAIHTVTASLFFNIYQTKELEVYWLVSAGVSTLTAVHTDIRADWGLILHYEGDKWLRKNLTLSRSSYWIILVVDVILNVGWVFTVSNNFALDIGIAPLYFLMIVSYVQLGRKGIWMFMRVEEDHANNVAKLVALHPDHQEYARIEKVVRQGQEGSVNNANSNGIDSQQIQIQLSEQNMVTKANNNKGSEDSSLGKQQPKSIDSFYEDEYFPPASSKVEQSGENLLAGSKSNSVQPQAARLEYLLENVKKGKMLGEEVVNFEEQLSQYLAMVQEIYQDIDLQGVE